MARGEHGKYTLLRTYREAAKQVATMHQRSALLAEDNASLVLQLEGRPNAKQLAHLQRQVCPVT